VETTPATGDLREPEPSDFLAHVDSVETPGAWEMIENGRYRPRRIRGSFLGRELG